jgi:hypothetical protein
MMDKRTYKNANRMDSEHESAALKGHDIPAQGSALGWDQHIHISPERA